MFDWWWYRMLLQRMQRFRNKSCFYHGTTNTGAKTEEYNGSVGQVGDLNSGRGAFEGTEHQKLVLFLVVVVIILIQKSGMDQIGQK